MMKKIGLILMATALTACGSDDDPKVDVNNANNANNVNNSNNQNNENNSNNVNNVNNTNNTNSDNNTISDAFYYEDVKPILDHSCAACHVSGGIGPFALTTFEESSSVAALIKTSVQSRSMPPFLPGPDCNEYEHDPSLSDEQIKTISDWVDGGALMGDPNNEGEAIERGAFTPPDFDTDLVMAEPYMPLKSPDDYRCFVVDWPHDSQKFITGFGVVPGEPSIVHHIIAFLAPPESVATAEANDANDPGPGYECFGEPNLGNSATAWLGSWAPGGVDSKYPENTGLPIEPGSKIVIQVHYNTLTADPVPDLSQIRIETADQVDKVGAFILWADPRWLNGSGMNIPAGDADAVHSFMFDPNAVYGSGEQLIFHGGGLHMHLLGTSAKTTVEHAGGEESCLIDIPDWDFNWQSSIQFQEPVVVERGDRLKLECHWDNSMENQPMVDGRRLTPEDRSWGDGSTDEMCLGVYYVTQE